MCDDYCELCCVVGVIYMSNDNDNDMIIMQIYSESERNFENCREKWKKQGKW